MLFCGRRKKIRTKILRKKRKKLTIICFFSNHLRKEKSWQLTILANKISWAQNKINTERNFNSSQYHGKKFNTEVNQKAEINVHQHTGHHVTIIQKIPQSTPKKVDFFSWTVTYIFTLYISNITIQDSNKDIKTWKIICAQVYAIQKLRFKAETSIVKYPKDNNHINTKNHTYNE